MKKTPDYMILINGENRLPDNFEDTVEIIPVENVAGEKYQIEKKTYEAFLRLREDLLANDGIQTELISVYRTVAQQEEIFDRYTKQHGLEYAKTYAALPGHSEHHTGFAIDVCVAKDGKVEHSIAGLLATEEFAAVHKKLPVYGFILRYPKGKEAITNVGYEPWHFRYIDNPEIAQEITDKGICFEEYWAEKE